MSDSIPIEVDLERVRQALVAIESLTDEQAQRLASERIRVRVADPVARNEGLVFPASLDAYDSDSGAWQTIAPASVWTGGTLIGVVVRSPAQGRTVELSWAQGVPTPVE